MKKKDNVKHMKGLIIIISISKEESMYLREKDPRIHITVINKYANARKKGWLVAEDGKTLALLRRYHREHDHVIERGGCYAE